MSILISSEVCFSKEELAKLVLTPEELTKIDYALPQEVVNRVRDWNIDMRDFYVWSYIKNETYGEPLNLAELFVWRYFNKIAPQPEQVYISLSASYYKDEVVLDLLSRCSRVYTTMWDKVQDIQQRLPDVVVLGYQPISSTYGLMATTDKIVKNLKKEFANNLVLFTYSDLYDLAHRLKTVPEVIKQAIKRVKGENNDR